MGIPKEELYHLVDRLPEQNLARAKRYLEKLVTNALPDSASTPRPHNKPCHIDPNCPECGTPLVLADILDDPNMPGEHVWHDEFACPKCRDCIYLDWPENKIATLSEGQCQEGGFDWDELKRELDI